MTRARDTANTQENIGGPVAPVVAGKNKIINGDFSVWQRGTSFVTNSAYTADRWFISADDVTGIALSQQIFTPGTAPVAGCEGVYFYRYARTSGTTTYNQLYQPIENVQTFAGQTATFSFWAKANASTTISVVGYQLFGTGGSSPVDIGLTGTASLTTSWQRFSFTTNVPSIAGKTVGAGSAIRPMLNFGTGNKTIDIWGVQFEAGSVATPFTPAGGGFPGAELALCQRYYFRVNAFATSQYAIFGAGGGNSATQARTIVPFPATMRTKPSAIDYPTLGSNFSIIAYDDSMNVAPTGLILDGNQTDTQSGYLLWNTSSGVVANRPCVVRGLATTGAYVGFTAEL